MIPAWAVRFAAALLAFVLVGGYGYHLGVQREHARTEARIQEAEANARAITAQRFKTLQEAQDAEHLARQAAQRDAAASRAAVVSLRQRATDFAARSMSDDSAAPAGCTAADDRARVLAELLSRAAERADQLAGAADSARIAGQLCERAYDSLKSE